MKNPLQSLIVPVALFVSIYICPQYLLSGKGISGHAMGVDVPSQ